VSGEFLFPERAPDALSGSAFARSIWTLPLGPEREEKILRQVLAGNVPSWMRQGFAVPVRFGVHIGFFFAASDYLSVGSDEDSVRVPLNPLTATVIADQVKATLPTLEMVNSIWTAAAIKFVYQGMSPTSEMTSTQWFFEHNAKIQAQFSRFVLPCSPADHLVAGHKKDVVICKELQDHPDRVAIYGWCKEIHQDNSWTVVQNLNFTSHDHHYADYSHGIRLISKEMVVDGEPVLVEDVLRDSDLCAMISDQGVIETPRYHANEG
jgi:hypothetical protein